MLIVIPPLTTEPRRIFCVQTELIVVGMELHINTKLNKLDENENRFWNTYRIQSSCVGASN